MYITLNEDVHAADTVEWDFFVFVLSPVAHLGHVDALGLVFFVAWDFWSVISDEQ